MVILSNYTLNIYVCTYRFVLFSAVARWASLRWVVLKAEAHNWSKRWEQTTLSIRQWICINLPPPEMAGRKDVRACGWRRELWAADFWRWPGCGTGQLTAAVVIHTPSSQSNFQYGRGRAPRLSVDGWLFSFVDVDAGRLFMLQWRAADLCTALVGFRGY